MAKKNTKSATFFTAPFILSYPKLVKAEAYMEDGKPKGEPHYSLEAISAKDSLAEWAEVDRDAGDINEGVNIQARCVALCKEMFGSDFNPAEAEKHGGLSWPFKDGDKRAEEKGQKGEHYRGKKFWRAKAKEYINGQRNEVTLYVNEGDGVRRLIPGTTEGDREIGQKFYGGAICTAEVNVVAGETAQGKYVTFYVNSVIFQDDGDRLGGESNVERFYGVKGGSSDYNPSKGMSGGNNNLDDEIPF